MSLKRKIVFQNFSKPKKKVIAAIHPTLSKLDKDHPLNPEIVKKWIVFNKGAAIEWGSISRQKKIGENERIEAKNKELDHKTYARECEHYLKTGDWISNVYGMYQENKIIWKSQLR